MLTAAEQTVMAETGLIPRSRLDALLFSLQRHADDAGAAAARLPKDSQAAAALRGRRQGYLDAMRMVTVVASGQGLRPRRGSAAHQKAIEFGLRRRRRRAAASTEGVQGDITTA